MSKAAKRERQRLNREASREAQIQADKRSRLLRTVRTMVIIVVLVGIAAFGWNLIRGDSGTDADADTETAASGSAVTCSDREPDETPEPQTYDAPPELVIDPARSYTAIMNTSCGEITIELDATQAPATVNSFVFLAREGFYDGLTFHRIVTDFVDQGGDPNGDGTGGPGYELPDEPPADGYRAGEVFMANSGPGTSGSQFFITVNAESAEGLATTGPFSILGQVTNGLDVAEKINTFGNATGGAPSRTIYIFSVTIEEGAATTTSSAPAS